MKEKNKEIKKLSEFVNLAWEVYSSLKNDNEKYFLKAIERADKLFDLKISRHYDRNFILKQEYLFIKFSYDIHCCLLYISPYRIDMELCLFWARFIWVFTKIVSNKTLKDLMEMEFVKEISEDFVNACKKGDLDTMKKYLDYGYNLDFAIKKALKATKNKKIIKFLKSYISEE